MGDEPYNLLWRVSWPLVIFLVGQLTAIVIWGVKLESRVTFLEVQFAHDVDHLREIDEKGTRRLLIIEDRQNSVLQRLRDLERIVSPNRSPPP